MTFFRYFERPHDFSTYTATPRECEFCGQVGSGYNGPFYGSTDEAFICEKCLASGALQERGLATNDGDKRALASQLKQERPGLSEEERQGLVERRTMELECCTPHLPTWQHMTWPAHCGDYCRFVKIAGQRDIVDLSGVGRGREFLAAHLHPYDRNTDLDYLWDNIREDSPQDNSTSYSTEFYLFQCTECGEHVLRWDCD